MLSWRHFPTLISKNHLHICRGWGEKISQSLIGKNRTLEENWIICCNDQAPIKCIVPYPWCLDWLIPGWDMQWYLSFKQLLETLVSLASALSMLSSAWYPISYLCIIVRGHIYLFFFIICELVWIKENTSTPLKCRRTNSVLLYPISLPRQKTQAASQRPMQASASRKTFSDLLF